MKQVTVAISTDLNPDPTALDGGDIVVWINNTATAQTVSSNDNGQTFTTGIVQPGASSLPITVPVSTAYTVSPAVLKGSITVNNPEHLTRQRRQQMALSFATDIKPMFSQMDQDHMLNQQEMFDLWNYGDVKSNAKDILAAVQSGKMPPSSSGEPRWPKDKVDKFQQWINEGCQP